MTKNEPVEIEINGQNRVLTPKEAEELLRSLVNKSRELFSANDIQSAKLKCALALKIDDEDVEALELFGDITKAEGHYEVSVGLYEAAYESGGRNSTLLLSLLAGNLRLGDTNRAKKYAIELTKVAPKIKTGWKNLTELAILDGEFDKALTTLETWIAHLGRSDETQYYEAVIRWSNDEKQTAIELFRLLAEKGTSLGQVYHYLSVYYYDREEYEKAIPHLKKYLELEGPDEEAEDLLQECYREISK
ncbi:hypothetical protein L0337_42395 [candidate division KSB1 bacterium]|nr:hypothetical protein [candidate division KSB1 bacterium]